MKELEDMQNYELFMVIIAGIQILRENERKQGYEDGQKDIKRNLPPTWDYACKQGYEDGLKQQKISKAKECFIIKNMCPYDYIYCEECGMYDLYKRTREKSRQMQEGREHDERRSNKDYQ